MFTHPSTVIPYLERLNSLALDTHTIPVLLCETTVSTAFIGIFLRSTGSLTLTECPLQRWE